jgi:hypothetical protein
MPQMTMNERATMPVVRFGLGRVDTIQNAISLMILFTCVFLSGCQDKATIWSAASRSPDGNWLATAHTDQYGGPGTAAVQTVVYLKWIKGSESPVQILAFSYDSAYPLGVTGVKMNWINPARLDVGYKGPATIDFQTIKCAGIDISVRDLSNDPPSSPH